MHRAFTQAATRPLAARWWHAAAILRVCSGIDFRRPASWIALAQGGWAGWWWVVMATADPVVAVGMGFLAAAVATVAALGDMPLELCSQVACCSPRTAGQNPLYSLRQSAAWLWACERTAWPLGGVVLGVAAAGGTQELLGALAVSVVGAMLAALTVLASRAAGAKAADSASLTLLVAAASAAAAVGVARPAAALPATTAVWLMLVGLAWAVSRRLSAPVDLVSVEAHFSARDQVPGQAPSQSQVSAQAPAEASVFGGRKLSRGGSDVLHLDALPASGPLRQILSRLAMVMSLAAMAGWLVLMPALMGGHEEIRAEPGMAARGAEAYPMAVAWALLSAAWFIGLAVPQATLQDGAQGSAGWERLLRTAARAGHRGPSWRKPFALPRFTLPRLGPVRFAGGVALSQAAILGWPAVVCVVLSLPARSSSGVPLGIVIGLGAAATVVTAGMAIGAAVGTTRETVFAGLLALVVGILAIVAFSPIHIGPTHIGPTW